MKSSNKIIVDLNKVTYARLRYKCDNYGVVMYRDLAPLFPSVMGEEIKWKELRFGTSESMLAYAIRRGLLDKWFPELELQLSNNHSLIYTGQKALDLWDAWKAKIFGGKK